LEALDVGVRRVEELLAYQLSVEFKRAVYNVVKTFPDVRRDLRYCDQLFAAASAVTANIVEGFGRRTAREFRQYLSYSRGSVGEAIMWLNDGVDRGHFTPEAVKDALALGRRTAFMLARLQRSLAPFIDPP
jgi:four helix bundle protein